MPDRLAEHAGHDALGCPLHELEGKRAADAVAHEEELADAEVIHQPELVVGEGAPGVVDRDRAAGLAAVGVALVHRDAAEVVLELLHRVDHRGRPVADAGVQAPTGGDQQREAGAGLLVADADVALFVERHGSLSLHSVVFCGRSRIDQTREHLESSSRHGRGMRRCLPPHPVHSCPRLQTNPLAPSERNDAWGGSGDVAGDGEVTARVTVACRMRSASPLQVLLYALWSRRSRMASTRGGFPMAACQWSTGNGLVTMVAHRAGRRAPARVLPLVRRYGADDSRALCMHDKINRPRRDRGTRRVCAKRGATFLVLRQSGGPGHKAATAIGTDVPPHRLDAGGAKRPCRATPACLWRLGRQRLVAVLAGWTACKHRVFPLSRCTLASTPRLRAATRGGRLSVQLL